MKAWDPELYLQFEEERTRPARDLLARITLKDPHYVSDLGCGPGNSTALLYDAYPQATITGVDSSEPMLQQARQRLTSCVFQLADVSTWHPKNPQNIIYANAALQWVPDHKRLLPHLVQQLAQDGVLAFQMPDNLDQPSHALMRKVAIEGAWKDKIGESAFRSKRLLATNTYYDLLAGQGCEVDIWRTTYYHVMPSATAIVDWVRSTGLRPFLSPLDESEQKMFLQRYLAELQQAYRRQENGNVLLAFPRIFIVARKSKR